MEGGKISRIVDGSDEQNSNWMKFVNCARDSKEQNLVAVQFRGEIYYKTCIPVEAGSELLVWFDDSVSFGSSAQTDQLGKLSVVAVAIIIFYMYNVLIGGYGFQTLPGSMKCFYCSVYY